MFQFFFGGLQNLIQPSTLTDLISNAPLSSNNAINSRKQNTIDDGCNVVLT
jgi:hypothetical protein